MPAFYAHYRFGEKVLEQLPEDLKECAQTWRKLYDIGLHGPDILYFYHPIRQTEICRLGMKIHHESGRAFFENVRERIRSAEKKDQDEMMAYAMGCICHFALDSACHPYIDRYAAQTGITHHEIEKELEKAVMKSDGVEPFQYDFSSAFRSDREAAGIIAAFYGIRMDQAAYCLKSYLRYTKIFFSTSKLLRGVIFSGLKVSGHHGELKGLFTNPKDSEKCLASSRLLMEYLEENVQAAADMIDEYDDALWSDTVLSAWYDRAFC